MRYCFVKPLQKDILIWQQPKEVTAAWRLLSAFKERKWYKRFSVSASLCFYSKSLYWIQMRWTVKKKWVNFPICLRWCFLGGGEWYPDTDPLQSDQCSNHYSSPKESYWFFFFFFCTFPLLSSPLVINLHMPFGQRNKGCIWYCIKSLINQAGLDVSHCLQCHVATASICCGQPGQKLHIVGSVV